jgi:hypothetical protein
MSSIVYQPPKWLTAIPAYLWSQKAWVYTGGKRDLRLDLLRGFAVVAMIVDHIGGEQSWLYAITGGDHFFVSVAEAFVFLSGLVMGIVYTEVIARQGLGAALMKCLQRSWSLYLLTVSLTLGYAVVLLQLGHWTVPEETSMAWPTFIMSAVTLHRTIYLTDILLLYTLLMLLAVPVFILLTHGYTSFVLAGSWGLWLLWQLDPQHAQFPWAVDNNYFHFAAWQVVFITALVIGYHRQWLVQRCARLSPHTVLVVSGVLVASAVVLYTWHLLPGLLIDQLFGKVDLRIGRLLLFASFFSFAFALLSVAWVPICHTFGWLLLPLGQNALTAYNLHIFVVAVLTRVPSWIAADTPPTALHNTLLQMVGVGCIWAVIQLQPAVIAQSQKWRLRMTDLVAVRSKAY